MPQGIGYQIVEVDGEELEFPADMSDDQIRQAIGTLRPSGGSQESPIPGASRGGIRSLERLQDYIRSKGPVPTGQPIPVTTRQAMSQFLADLVPTTPGDVALTALGTGAAGLGVRKGIQGFRAAKKLSRGVRLGPNVMAVKTIRQIPQIATTPTTVAPATQAAIAEGFSPDVAQTIVQRGLSPAEKKMLQGISGAGARARLRVQARSTTGSRPAVRNIEDIARDELATLKASDLEARRLGPSEQRLTD